MPTAAIRWGGNPSGYTGLAVSTPIQLTNSGSGGETSWDYALISRPVGSTAELAPVSGHPDKRSLTPDVIGTYIVRLVVNYSIVDVSAAAVLHPSGIREPAVGEREEWGGSYGWAESMKAVFTMLDGLAYPFTLTEEGSDPSQVANAGRLYTKDVSGTTELFYRDDTGTVRQLTPPSGGSSLASILGSTYSSVQQMHDVIHSAGVIEHSNIIDDGDGTITVPAGNGLIRATDDSTAQLLFFDWALEAGTNVNLSDGTMNYVYVEYT